MSGNRIPRSGLSMMPLGVLFAGALAIGLLAVLAGSTAKGAGAQACSGQFTIDFAGLPAGTILGEQYAAAGVHISGAANHGGPNALIVFDSNSTDTDLDADLRVGIGNIAIFANDLTDTNPADGLVDKPDENNYGGRAKFAFDQDVSIGSFKFIDKDHEPPDSAVAYDGSGNVIKQVPIPVSSNGSVQTIAVNADGVRRFEVVYGDSGGFTGIVVDCGQAGPVPTPTAGAPTPTPAAIAGGTPTAAAAAVAPTTGGGPAVAVAGESAAARQSTAVLAAVALPAGGGSPEGAEMPTWLLALPLLAVAIGGSILLLRRKSR